MAVQPDRPKGFAYAAEIEGRTTVDAWRKAIDQLQLREGTQRIGHDPLLEPLSIGSSLNKQQNCREFFPISFLPRFVV